MLVADARLRSLAERHVSPLEERLARLEKLAARSETIEETRAGQTESVERHPAETPVDPQRIETRLAELKNRTKAMDAERVKLGEQVGLLWRQSHEQAEYTRIVHSHLDNLGAHTESVRDRLTRQIEALEGQVARLGQELRRLQTPTDAA